MKHVAILIIFTAFAFNAFAANKDCAKESNYPEISKNELQKLVTQRAKDNVFVVDVNSKESYAKNHIPKAIHYGENQTKFATVLPKQKDALIVAYCGGPSCGAWKKAAKDACELGYTNIKHFKGGISGWTGKG